MVCLSSAGSAFNGLKFMERTQAHQSPGQAPAIGLLVVTDPDVVAGRREGIPGDVEPAVAGKQLVGMLADLQEFNERPKLRRVFRPDIGSLAEKVLGSTDTHYPLVDFGIAEAGVDDERPCYHSCRLEQQMAAVVQIRHDLHRRDVLRIFLQIEELAQLKVRR